VAPLKSCFGNIVCHQSGTHFNHSLVRFVNEDLLTAMGMPVYEGFARIMGLTHPVHGYKPKPSILRGMAGIQSVFMGGGLHEQRLEWWIPLRLAPILQSLSQALFGQPYESG
jgi:hypothetical protein